MIVSLWLLMRGIGQAWRVALRVALSSMHIQGLFLAEVAVDSSLRDVIVRHEMSN